MGSCARGKPAISAPCGRAFDACAIPHLIFKSLSLSASRPYPPRPSTRPHIRNLIYPQTSPHSSLSLSSSLSLILHREPIAPVIPLSSSQSPAKPDFNPTYRCTISYGNIDTGLCPPSTFLMKSNSTETKKEGFDIEINNAQVTGMASFSEANGEGSNSEDEDED